MNINYKSKCKSGVDGNETRQQMIVVLLYPKMYPKKIYLYIFIEQKLNLHFLDMIFLHKLP